MSDRRRRDEQVRPETAIECVAIVGCGLMGAGIAESCARAGISVVAIKATPGDASLVRRKIEASLEALVTKGKIDAAARASAAALLEVTTDLGAAHRADLIIESAVESLPEKQALLARLEACARPDAILATNTSSLAPRDIGALLERPERFMGLHFFSPAQVMMLCEIAPTPATDERAIAGAVAFVEALGKTPIVVRDEPGYIVNRLIVPCLLHAMQILEDGVAETESIDLALKLGCGHPVGPLALADLIGLDVVLAMAKSLYDEYREDRYHAPPILRRLVLAGQLGKKARAGFYLYGGATLVPNPSVLETLRLAGDEDVVA